MHCRLLVTLNKGEASSSEEARIYANDILLNDSSFTGEGGRFGGQVCDWFVIGGRWSGELSEVSWGKKLYEQIRKMEEEADIQIRGCSYGREKKREEQAKLTAKAEKIYSEALPEEYKGLLTYDRNTYVSCGYEDDAMVLTKELYDTLIKEHEGCPIDDSEYGPTYVDLEYDCADPEMIGEKWLVVVDYHS